MQQGLEEDHSLMLDMHKGVRLFTQPYLSYEFIQRASCNPILEHVRSAFMKMLCMLRKEYNILMWHIPVPVHRGIFWWLEVCISTEQKIDTFDQIYPDAKFLFTSVCDCLVNSVSRTLDYWRITRTFTIQIFLAWKLKSRNICQVCILHFLFVEFLLFTELFCYQNCLIKEICTHHLPVFTYTIQEMTSHLKMHRLDKINKPVKFVKG